ARERENERARERSRARERENERARERARERQREPRQACPRLVPPLDGPTLSRVSLGAEHLRRGNESICGDGRHQLRGPDGAKERGTVL
ncbi:hypothetical protein T484DRAFT_1906904, partial [Baffinella frigidus]